MYAFLLFLVIAVKSQKTVIVRTSYGDIIGQSNDGYNTFFGVPYAKINEDNPFTESLPHPKFDTPFIANDSSIMCPQFVSKDQINGTLHCLCMNIYVPQTDTKKRAVLVWFPGENFMYGYAGKYDGQHLARKDVIVVIVNFRLGPYGFFCMHETLMPGNQGMRDQVDALRWVHKEIGAFGGDPYEVTIGGQGIGGGYVDLHMYSEYTNENLFEQAIIQSGSIYLKGFYVKPYPKAAVKMAEYFGKSVGRNTHPRDIISFLSHIDPFNIINATVIMGLHVGICRERDYHRGVHNFVLHDPFHFESVQKSSTSKFLIGYNTMELLSEYANKETNWTQNAMNLFCSNLDLYFTFSAKEKENLCRIIQKFYFINDVVDPETLQRYIIAESDLFVNHAVERSVDKYIKAEATIFKYVFSYTGTNEYSKIVPDAGTSHGDELKFLLSKTSLEGKEQEMLRKNITRLWANFIKYGNPTPVISDNYKEAVIWAPTNLSSMSYLDINLNMTMKNHLYGQRMAFWDLLWHAYEKSAILNEGV